VDYRCGSNWNHNFPFEGGKNSASVISIEATVGNDAKGMKAEIPASKGLQRITFVELTGRRSNYFEGDLSSAIKHLNVID